MPIDTSMYNALQPVKIDSPIDAYGKVAQFQQMQNQNKLAQLTMQQHQRSLDADNALASLLSSGGKPEDVVSGLAQKGFGDRAMAYQKQQLELVKQQADVGKTNADAQKSQWEVLKGVNGLVGSAAGAILQNPTYENAVATVNGLKTQLGPELSAKMGLDNMQIPSDPAQLKQWANGHYLKSISTEKMLEDARVKSEGAANRENQIKTTAMNNATSRANNAANINKDLMVAGLNKDGSASSDIDMTAKAIASGQLPPPTGMALLNPRNQRVLARVMEINPDYDYTTVAAKKKAASDFTSGQQGNAMRSFAVAGQHLDQLGQLVDAMNNGNSQLVNKIANTYSQQTGNPAVTNFDAAKDVVSKEVTKAIVAGGGGVSERQELSDMMKNVKSPAQLKGVIAQYRNLMAAQHDALLQQRRAAGLSDSTLPKYTDANGSSPVVPAKNSKGWTLHRDANGNQAYVSPDGKQYEEVK